MAARIASSVFDSRAVRETPEVDSCCEATELGRNGRRSWGRNLAMGRRVYFFSCRGSQISAINTRTKSASDTKNNMEPGAKSPEINAVGTRMEPARIARISQ